MKRVGVFLSAVIVIGVGFLVFTTGGPDPEQGGSSTDAAGLSRPGDQRPEAGSRPALPVPQAAASDTPTTSPRLDSAGDLADTLRIQVVDQDGRPCPGVPLALFTKHGSMGLCLWSGVSTAPDGDAVIGDMQEIRKKHDKAWEPDFCFRQGSRYPKTWGAFPEPTLAVTFAFPHRGPVYAAFPPDAPPHETIRLKLPPTGRVVVELRDEDGRPIDLPAPVALSFWQSPKDRADRVPPSAWVEAEAEACQGRATFPFVGLGLQLRACADMSTLLREEWTVHAGPSEAGETVVIPLTIEGLAATVTGRFLDATGKPVADEWIDITLPAHALPFLLGRFLSQGHVRTDTEGRFRLGFPRTPLAVPRPVIEFRRLGESPDSPDENASGAALVIPAVLPPGEFSVGDVVLRPVKDVVSGRVVDALGRPVAGEWIYAEELRARRPDREQLIGRPPLNWRLFARLRSDAAGRFVLRDIPRLCRYRFIIDSPGDAKNPQYPSRPRVVAQGTRDLELKLLGKSAIRGSLRLPPGTPRFQVAVRLHRDPSDCAEGVECDEFRDLMVQEDGEAMDDLIWHPVRRAQVNPDGSFAFSPVPPGPCRITIGLDGEPPACEIAGIQVTAGRDVQDRRLQEIDLRERIRFAWIDVRGPEGEEVKQCDISVGPQRIQVYEYETRPDSDARKIATTCEELHLHLDAPGYRSREVRLPVCDQVVRLHRGLRVRLVLADHLAPLPMLHRLLVLVIPHREDDNSPNKSESWWNYRGHGFDETGAVRIALPSPGRYRLLWVVDDPEDSTDVDGTPWATGRLPITQTLDISDRAEEQTIQVSPPPELLPWIRRRLQAIADRGCTPY
jgi:protocatechuate 3,4-dioxygenase beta subunit